MAHVMMESQVERLARLQATIDAMQTELDGLHTAAGKRPRRRSWRRRGVLLTGVALAAAMIAGVAGASAPGNPADVTYISLTVPHKVLSNTSIAKAATNSPVVIGASTTVPSDATSVQMTVAVKSTAAGTLAVFPTDNPGSSTADTIAFPAGNVVVSAQTKQSPGLSGKVSFKNNGTATATVTVTITGYSTQTTASNVSGSGGTAGQVLTNNGSGGASWQTVSATGGAAGGVLTGTYPNPGLANNVVTNGKLSAAGSASGQVLTSTGGTVIWANPKVPGYTRVNSAVISNPPGAQSAGTVSCPSGTVVLGGGAFTSSSTPGQQEINTSYPSSITTWQVFVDNTSAASLNFTVYAICGTGP